MKVKKRVRYYCDFCGRGMSYRGQMEKHERGCTANPNRVCGLHAKIGETNEPIPTLLAAFQDGGLKGLRNRADNCPACILAAARIGKLDLPFPEFDFKTELASWWSDYKPNDYPDYY